MLNLLFNILRIVFLCTFAVSNLNNVIMDLFKFHFNRDFSLSFNGKFIGLDSLPNRALFEHKFRKIVERRDVHKKPLGNVITFKLSGKVCKLYHR